MKTKPKNKILIYKILGCMICLVAFISCGIEWFTDHGSKFDDEYKDNNSPIIYKTNSVKAGEYAEFVMYIKCGSNIDGGRTEKLIIAVNVPKVWTDAKNAIVTWEGTGNGKNLEGEHKMSPIPDGTSPVSKPGLTWDQALLNKFGGENPNVLDDTQWVAFVSDAAGTIDNGGNAYDLYVKIKIKMKTGPDNLRAKIGFFANYESDGLSEYSSGNNQVGPDHWKVMWGDCFEVTDGEGVEPIDFCQYHFYQVTPGNAAHNDILTFRYIGDYYNNQLINESNIYLNAKAHTANGNTYTVDEISDKTKLLKDSRWGVMWSATLWPEGFFGVPANETITHIEYYFTNADGSLFVDKYDDEQAGKDDPAGDDDHSTREKKPFVYNFVCK